MVRFLCGLLLIVTVAATLWAQREPCLAGADTPECGIKITMNPQAPSESVLLVPNEITVEVPLRLHPNKVQLKSGPSGTEVPDAFKLIAETTHYKKSGGVVSFKLEIKSCPGTDNALDFNIFSPRLPYPITVNRQPIECKQGEGK
jgi:hypothetical protein